MQVVFNSRHVDGWCEGAHLLAVEVGHNGGGDGPADVSTGQQIFSTGNGRHR